MTPTERMLLAKIRVLEKKLASAGGGSSVPTSRQVISGGGLTGGGDLSADRTLAVGAGTGITVNADDVAVDQSVLKLDDFAAPDDNTDLDASATKHGLMPKWTSALISALLDLISTTRGAILYRGATAWSALSPGTSGDVLTSNGAGADPSYETPSGGSGITELTGDVTAGPGSGSQAATIPNDTVTYAKMQNVSATARALGRKTSGAGDIEELTLSELLDFIGSAAQGDILYRGSSGWARLAAGSAGKVLTTHSTGANPTWETVGASGGASSVLQHIQTVSPSAVTSIDLESFAGGGWSYLEFIIRLTVAVDAAQLQMRFKLNGTYKSSADYQANMRIESASGSTDVPNTTAASQMALTGTVNFGIGADTLESYCGCVSIYFPDDTSKPKRMLHEGQWQVQTGNSVFARGQGMWIGADAANALQGVQFLCTQNMTGTIECYGRKP